MALVIKNGFDLVIKNCFDVLTDEHDDLVTADESKKTTAASMPTKISHKQTTKKKQQYMMDIARPTRETSIRRPKQKPMDFDAMQNQRPKEKDERDVVGRTLTLEEYENKLLEKKKAISALKNVERKVSDKDFESMKLLDKRKDNIVEKPKKDYTDRRSYEAKIHKSVDKSGLLSTLKIFV